MKKELADKWVKALESKKYRQSFEELKTDEGRYSCLGVLAKICGYESQNHIWYGDMVADDFGRYCWPELKTQDARLPNCSYYRSLRQAETHGLLFEDIAKLIKRYWRYL